jgi:hypothetical protein
MGKRLTKSEHRQILLWGERKLQVSQNAPKIRKCELPITVLFDEDLKNYFRLCCLARSKSSVKELSESAHALIFKVRTKLEREIAVLLEIQEENLTLDPSVLYKNNFYGFSKKQGTSLRMPLSSCMPTALCAGGCYAHDVLDATPAAVIRGVINGHIAKSYEQGDKRVRAVIMDSLKPHTRKAVSNSRRELKDLPIGFKRRAYIRFSHVGEVANFPEFANALAKQVRSESRKSVDCVIYTRHKNAKLLDPELWVMNFTLDPVSLKRESWAPEEARIVYSAFGGVTSSIAEVNFLEHHRHQHLAGTEGDGHICPATKPETKDRTCDACRCNTCFVKPKIN